jgi:hypothetical protein
MGGGSVKGKYLLSLLMSLIALGAVSSPAGGQEIDESRISELGWQIESTVKQAESTVRHRPQELVVSKELQANTKLLASLPNVQTWEQFVEGGGNRYIQVDYDFPNEFRDGFVYFFNQGPSVITAYIIKPGLSRYPTKKDLLSIDSELASSYVKSGQAIKFSWNLGRIDLRYTNETEVRFLERGKGCFRATCLTAPFMTHSQISYILYSKRRI